MIDADGSKSKLCPTWILPASVQILDRIKDKNENLLDRGNPFVLKLYIEVHLAFFLDDEVM